MFDFAPSRPEHALMQDPAFAAALRACGQHPITLDSGLIVLQRRFAGMRVAMLARATPPPDLRRQLRGAGVRHAPLILSPEEPTPSLRAIRLRKPTRYAEIDLSAPQAVRRARLNGKWRNQLRRAEHLRLDVTDAPLQPEDPLIMQDVAQGRAKGYANWPPGLTSAFAALAPDQTRLFTAYDRNEPIARMLFLIHGARASYHIGHASLAGRVSHAHNLLLWRAGNWLAERGITRLDLGKLDDRTPSLNRFKLRASGVPRRTGGTWLTLA